MICTSCEHKGVNRNTTTNMHMNAVNFNVQCTVLWTLLGQFNIWDTMDSI